MCRFYFISETDIQLNPTLSKLIFRLQYFIYFQNLSTLSTFCLEGCHLAAFYLDFKKIFDYIDCEVAA